jgi:PIN domain nuclease of toxin-antitoxin system
LAQKRHSVSSFPHPGQPHISYHKQILINDEPGSDIVAKALPGAAVNAVNFSEVVAKLAEASVPEWAIREALGDLGLEVVAFDQELAHLAGLLRPGTRQFGLSLGDRACLAMAQHLSVPAMTTDGVWRKFKIGVEIRVVR